MDVTLPDPAADPMPAAGYPVIAMMHGCCGGSKTGWEADRVDAGGERWHYSNAWFASRGYAVVTYTARGFVDGDGHGSTGQTQLDSDRFEINDFQHLVGQLADKGDLDPGSAGVQKVNPQRVAATGGSYGGGFSWMALTDPVWHSPGGTPMRLAPRRRSTAGRTFSNRWCRTAPTRETPCQTRRRPDPRSASRSGRSSAPCTCRGRPASRRVPATRRSRRTSTRRNPLCASTLGTTLPRFLNERSAYLENGFFARLANGTLQPVPVFSAGTFTDPLFPPAEHRRMAERLKATVPGYPVQEYYGDYQHFVQNKAKEWGDVCGADRHVCRYGDYAGGNMDATPAGLAR